MTAPESSNRSPSVVVPVVALEGSGDVPRSQPSIHDQVYDAARRARTEHLAVMRRRRNTRAMENHLIRMYGAGEAAAHGIRRAAA